MDVIRLTTGPLGVNTYLVGGGAAGFVIDPGGEPARILACARERGWTLKAQLLTHAHFDHMGACAALREAGLPLYVHEADADKARGKGNLCRFFGLPQVAVEPDVLLRGNQILDLAGLSVRVLSTPGHSSGSVCYLVEDVLFSGDTLFHLSVGRTDFPDGSAEQLGASLRRLFALPGDYRVCPGHEEETTLEEERQNNFLAGGLL